MNTNKGKGIYAIHKKEANDRVYRYLNGLVVQIMNELSLYSKPSHRHRFESISCNAS